MGSEVKAVTSQDELKEFLNSNSGKLIVLDFYAEWCGPCKMIAPQVANLAREMDTVAFAKIDVDENEEIAAEYQISAMPTFVLIKDGKQIDTMMGANKDKLVELINQHK